MQQVVAAHTTQQNQLQQLFHGMADWMQHQATQLTAGWQQSMQSMQQASHSNLAEMQAVQNRATAEIVQSINQQHTETVQAMAQLLHAHLPKQPAAPPPKHLKPPPPLPGAEPATTENAKGEGKNKGGDKGGGKDKGGNKDKGGDKDKGGSKDKGGKQFGPEERPPQKKNI